MYLPHCGEMNFAISAISLLFIHFLYFRKLGQEIKEAKKTDSRTVLMEGKRLIQDAMKSGFYPKTFAFSRLNLLPEFEFEKSKELNMVQIPYRNVQAWSDVTTSPGFIGS